MHYRLIGKLDRKTLTTNDFNSYLGPQQSDCVGNVLRNSYISTFKTTSIMYPLIE